MRVLRVKELKRMEWASRQRRDAYVLIAKECRLVGGYKENQEEIGNEQLGMSIYLVDNDLREVPYCIVLPYMEGLDHQGLVDTFYIVLV